MDRVRSFAPLARPDARVLILGSMPGVESLRRRQYYAHPSNQFWPIMGALFGADAALSYRERVDRLLGQGIAVWDVLRHCERDGSLDSAIRPGSEALNDFRGFFRRHAAIGAVFFNGRKSEDLFIRDVRPALGARGQALRCEHLPSTSPAHAAVPRASKLAAWGRIRDCL